MNRKCIIFSETFRLRPTAGRAALLISPIGGHFWRIFRLHEPMKYLETRKEIRLEGLQDYLAILQSVLIILQVLP
jgi:hypothetical protein